jgi:hypothetical protein
MAKADQQLIEKLDKYEKNLDQLYDIFDEYRITEAELNLHHSMAQKGLKATEDLILAMKTMARIGGKADLPLAEKTLRQAKAQLKLFSVQLSGWINLVSEAQKTTREICQAAEQEQNQSERENVKTQAGATLHRLALELDQRRKSLNRAWQDLAQDSDNLALQVGRLKAVLQQREFFQNTYQGMAANLTQLRQAGNDLDKAEKLLKKLRALRMAFSVVRVRDIRFELFALQDRLLQTQTPESDPVWARIENSINKTNELYLPENLPQLIKYPPLAQDFLNNESNPDPARLRENFGRAQNLVDQAQGLLPQIRQNLLQASNSQALFAGLTKARACLARLDSQASHTNEQNLTNQINRFRWRIEDAERKLHLFQKWNRDTQVTKKQMEQLVRQAQALHEAQTQAASQFDESQYGPSAESLLGGLEQSLDQLEQALAQLNQMQAPMHGAAQNAREEKRKTCGQAEKAAHHSSPGQEEIRIWHNRAEQGCRQVELQVENTETGLMEAIRATEQSLNHARNQNRELQKALDQLLKKIKLGAHLRVNLEQARQLLAQAEEMWHKVKRDAKGLAEKKKKDYEDVLRLLVEIGRSQDKNPQNRELAQLKQSTRELAERYQNTRPTEKPEKPMAPYILISATKGLEKAISKLEDQAAEAAKALRKSQIALSQALTKLNASQNLKARARQALAQAKACLTSLARATGAGADQSLAIRQALSDCDFEKAQSLINKLPPGPVHTGQQARLDQARNQEGVIENLVNQARQAYTQCEYLKADEFLARALNKAQCSKHKKSITDKMQKNQAAQRLEAGLKKLVDQAREQYRDCYPDKALDTLKTALNQAKCEKHIQSIKAKIKLAQKLKEYEKNTFSLLEKANKLYRDAKYLDAKKLLQEASEYTSCKRIKGKLAGKIKTVQAKIDSRTTDTQSIDEQEQSNQTSCQIFLNQLNDKRAEIKKHIAYFSRLKENNQSKELTGRAACRIVDASKEMSRLKLAAKESGCLDAARIKNPLGLNAVPGLVCYLHRGGGGNQRQTIQYDAGACAALRKNMGKMLKILKKRLRIYTNYKNSMPSSPNSVHKALLQRAACSLVIGVRDYRVYWQKSKKKGCPWLNSMRLPAVYDQANLPHCPNYQ